MLRESGASSNPRAIDVARPCPHRDPEVTGRPVKPGDDNGGGYVPSFHLQAIREASRIALSQRSIVVCYGAAR